METVRTEPESTAVAGWAALALATGAALSLTIANVLNLHANADELVTLGFILGWVLVVWATIVGAAVVVQLVRRRPAAIEILLIVAAAAVIAVTVSAYPLFGSGGASA
ncbi:hypothetical protein [Microbacterium rhizophilus]|uniref:hypothetical protein n=1 Tax=Microbacterium rhizophilus TaxID=3138934 RepID=UPI0031EA7C97